MKNKFSFIGNILLGISFLTLSALSTRTGNGTNALILFGITAVLFTIGTVLKALNHKDHAYYRNLPSALLIAGGVFLLDLFLKWINTDQLTLQNFGSIFFKVVTLYPLQPMEEMWYRSFDPCGLLFLTLLFRGREKEERSPSLFQALCELIGDNLYFYLIADILVSTFPVYWFGSRPGILRLVMDVVMGTVISGVCVGYVKEKDPVDQKLWDTCTEFLKKTEKVRVILYYVAFGGLFFYNFMNTTVIPDWMVNNHPEYLGYLEYFNMPMIVLAALLAFASVFEADRKYERNIIAIDLFLGFIFYGNSQVGVVFSLFLLTAGAVKKNAKTILTISFVEGFLIMLIAWGGVQAGVLMDVLLDERHGLGIIYATDCYAHWFYLFVTYCLIRKGKFRWYEYVISFAWMFWLYRWTKADASFICFLLVFVLMLFRQYISPKMHPKSHEKLSKVLVWSYVICAGIYFVALLFADQLTPFLQAHFVTLWERLYYGQVGLSRYPVRFLYQLIPEAGNGLYQFAQNGFFFLDVSYIRILLKYGILVFAYFMVICTWFMNHARNRKWWILFVVLAVIALQSLIEQHLAEYWYNVLIILPLADFSYLDERTE